MMSTFDTAQAAFLAAQRAFRAAVADRATPGETLDDVTVAACDARSAFYRAPIQRRADAIAKLDEMLSHDRDESPDDVVDALEDLRRFLNREAVENASRGEPSERLERFYEDIPMTEIGETTPEELAAAQAKVEEDRRRAMRRRRERD